MTFLSYFFKKDYLFIYLFISLCLVAKVSSFRIWSVCGFTEILLNAKQGGERRKEKESSGLCRLVPCGWLSFNAEPVSLQLHFSCLYYLFFPEPKYQWERRAYHMLRSFLTWDMQMAFWVLHYRQELFKAPIPKLTLSPLFPPRHMVSLLFVPAVIFCPKRQWPVHCF